MKPENITITDPAPSTAGSGITPINPDQIDDFDGSNQLGNLTSFDAESRTPGTSSDNFYWDSNASEDFSAAKALSLPEMGVAPFGSYSPTLSDTAEQLRIVLPQLSSGQLASFQSIVVSDNKTLSLDAGTFQRLDTATQTANWSSHRGTNVLNENGTQTSLVITGSLDELVDNGILSASGIRNQAISGNQGINLLEDAQILVTSLDGLPAGGELEVVQTLLSQANLDFDTDSTSMDTIEMDAYEFVSLAAASQNPPFDVKLVDTPAAIKDILLSKDPAVIAARNTVISEIASTNSPAAVELTLEQFVEANGAPFTGIDNINLPVTNLFNNLGNVELVVSGTSEELNALFAQFGQTFDTLGAGVSFRVTDGGEVVLNTTQLDVLDGRLTGAANVVDNSTGVASMLEGAIPTTVKDITVDNDGDMSTRDNLVLTVSQFRNLPDYANDDVVIRDGEVEINRALSYGTLDDRVRTLELTEAGIDGGLTLNVATAEKLGERAIRVNGAPAPLVIRDRASTIANFIETGSLPEMGSVMFVESRGNVINLNDEQLAAWNRLSEYTNVLTEFGDVKGAAFEEDDLKGYIDERISDLSNSLDYSVPLGLYVHYRIDLKIWDD